MATAATIDVLLRANTATYRSAMIDAGRVANQNLGAIRKEAAQTAQSIQALNRAAAGFVGFQAFKSGVGALLEVTKQNQALVNSMRASVNSSTEAARALAFVGQVSKELGLDFQLAAQGFQRLTASATANGVAMRDQEQLFLELSRAATSMQIAPAVVDRAMTALSQSFSKGRFQAEELRQQLAEAIPGVVPRFQRAVMQMIEGTDLAGKSFDQLLQGGLLDTARFLPAMTQAFAEMGRNWQDGAVSLQAETNRLKNSWRELKLSTSDGLFSDVAITSIRLMAENLERVAGAATLAGGVIAARVLGAGAQRGANVVSAPARQRLSEAVNTSMLADMARSRARDAAAQVEQARASLALNATWKEQSSLSADVARGQMAVAFANNEAAQRTLAHTQNAATLSANLKASREAAAASVVAQRRLAQAQANYNAAVASGNVATQQEIALKGRLIAAQEAAAVATNNLAAARGREAAAARAGTLAGAVGGAARSIGAGALALTGGPWGAAILAVGALGYAFVNMQRKAEDARKEFAAQVDSLNLLNVSIEDTINQYNRLGSGVGVRDLASAWNAAGVEIRKADKDIEALQRRIETLQAQSAGYNAIGSGSAAMGAGSLAGVGVLGELEEAQEQLRKLRAESEPTRAQFLKLEETLRQTVRPDIFERMREAALKADDVSFDNLRSQLPEVARAALDAGMAIDSMLGKLRESALARFSRAALGEVGAMREQFEQTLIAEQAYSKLTREEVAERRRQFGVTVSFIEASKKLEEQKNKESRSIRSGVAAAKAQENQYISIIDRINRQIALDREAMLVNDKMTAAQKLQVIVTNELASAKNRLSDSEQARVKALLAEAVAQGSALKAMEDAKRSAEDLLRLRSQLQQERETQRLSNAVDLFGISRGSDTVEQMRRIIDLHREHNDRVRDLQMQAAMNPELKASYDAQLEMLGAFHQQALRDEEEYQKQRAEFMANGWNGARAALEDYIAQAKDLAGQTREIVGNIFSGAEDLAVEFFTKGRADWKAYVDDIHAQFMRLIVRQQLAKVAEKFLPGLGSGDQATALSTAAGKLAASAAPLYGAAAALSASAAALAAAGIGSAAGGGGGWANLFTSLGSVGFDRGGYTGPGGRLQPAGVVHKGEVVWSQPDVARAGGVAVVEAMRRGLRGYADGGWVSGSRAVAVGRRSDDSIVPGGAAGGGVTIQNTNVFQRPVTRSTATQLSVEVAQKNRQALSRNS